MADFPFTDLHSFKDYVTFVQTYLPDQFHVREGANSDEQWTLDLAFEGLRLGLDMAVGEKGPRLEFEVCRRLVDDAYACYKANLLREGFMKLEEVRRLLKKISSR